MQALLGAVIFLAAVAVLEALTSVKITSVHHRVKQEDMNTVKKAAQLICFYCKPRDLILY